MHIVNVCMYWLYMVYTPLIQAQGFCRDIASPTEPAQRRTARGKTQDSVVTVAIWAFGGSSQDL